MKHAAALVACALVAGCAHVRADPTGTPREARARRVFVVVCVFSKCELPPEPAEKKTPPTGGAN